MPQFVYRRTKELVEEPQIHELQNIERTVFNDEMMVDNMRSKVGQLSDDIKKAATVETRAIYLCRRGALLRKVSKHLFLSNVSNCVTAMHMVLYSKLSIFPSIFTSM